MKHFLPSLLVLNSQVRGDRIMNKTKLFHLKNAMQFANGMANFIGVFLVQTIFRTENPLPLPEDIVSMFDRIVAILSPSTFIIVITVTLIYERLSGAF